MKKLLLPLLALSISLSLSSCEEITNESELTAAEMAEGLKAALSVGTDTASAQLSVTDGYFKDQAVKILLPQQVQNSINTFKSKSINIGFTTVSGADLYDGYPALGINGLKSKEDDLIRGINRAAEDAASTAGPIFIEAITDMSIADASEILFSGNTHAATNYLEAQTSSSLFIEYEPRIDSALESVKVGNLTVSTTYENFVADYNAILNTNAGLGTIGSLMGINTIQATDLSEHATEKGLDGLFLKVAEEEEDIRKDPLARVSDILRKVFGELD